MAKNPITIKESKQEFITTRQEFIKNNNRNAADQATSSFASTKQIKNE
jgi:hypothetical protein